MLAAYCLLSAAWPVSDTETPLYCFPMSCSKILIFKISFCSSEIFASAAYFKAFCKFWIVWESKLYAWIPFCFLPIINVNSGTSLIKFSNSAFKAGSEICKEFCFAYLFKIFKIFSSLGVLGIWESFGISDNSSPIVWILNLFIIAERSEYGRAIRDSFKSFNISSWEYFNGKPFLPYFFMFKFSNALSSAVLVTRLDKGLCGVGFAVPFNADALSCKAWNNEPSAEPYWELYMLYSSFNLFNLLISVHSSIWAFKFSENFAASGILALAGYSESDIYLSVITEPSFAEVIVSIPVS